MMKMSRRETLAAKVSVTSGSMNFGKRTRWIGAVLLSVGLLSFANPALVPAQDPTEGAANEEPENSQQDEVSATSGDSTSSKSTGGGGSSSSSTPKHAILLKDAKPVPGMITLYQKGNSLYAELSGSDYSSEYLILISIARGIGQGTLLGGFSWGFGDDWVWKFRKIDDRVHVIRRNVRFKADKGSPEASAVKNAYTDSVLFSLPVLTKGPKGGDLIDLTSIFMSDLPQISETLPGFMFSASKSSWAAVKGFPDNLQLQVAATYASSGRMSIESVADSRGVTVNVHYSISKIPSNGYTPRLADDRVGYFMTVLKDYSKKGDHDQFVRYINRWDLQKADPSAKVSTPKEPIVFWIEKTVPFRYRPAIRAGIEEWNKAFEQAGFSNAIEVRQQPDDAEWDPEDINYNTFRWITSSAGFAMGPSRVNPYTGQILDADIIFDADFIEYWKTEYETMTAETVAAMTGGPLERLAPDDNTPRALFLRQNPSPNDCRLAHGMSSQFAFGSLALTARGDAKESAELQEKLIMQGLKEVTMHEVGHTLGLRHNFKASKLMSLKEMNDPQRANKPLVSSVMDYNATNIVPKEWNQGDFFTTTIGPYDEWAIEYGYKPLSGGPTGERDELKKIAARSGEPELQYATDEDTTGISPDPDANRFDLGDNPVEFAKMRSEMMKELIPGLVDRTTEEGDDYAQARRAFNVVVAQYAQSLFFAARYVGGVHTSRSHKGDKEAEPPFRMVDVKQQREALDLLEKNLFNDQPFQFPHELYNYLAPSRWQHWGMHGTSRKDFPLHDFILMWQSRVMDQLLSSVTLERMHDMELKTPPKEDVLTTAELIERLTKSIFEELDSIEKGNFNNREPAISSLRRNLQRKFLKRLFPLALGESSSPQDCQTIAYAELASLKDRMAKVLDANKELDSYTRAHLLESAQRINKVLEAQVSLKTP